MNGMMDSNKKRLLELLFEKSFQYNEKPIFCLASGKMSNYYFNCKKVTFNPEGKYLTGNILFEMISDLRIDAVGGMTLGADPIANAISLISYISAGCELKSKIENRKSKIIKSFSIRKKPKNHGLKLPIEGDINENDRVVILDDVVTTGQSTIEAIDAARDFKLNVVKAIALIDREEGGRENIEKKDVEFESLFRKRDFIYKMQGSR